MREDNSYELYELSPDLFEVMDDHDFFAVGFSPMDGLTITQQLRIWHMRNAMQTLRGLPNLAKEMNMSRKDLAYHLMSKQDVKRSMRLFRRMQEEFWPDHQHIWSEPEALQTLEQATPYSDYAVEANRKRLNQDRHGRLYEDQEEGFDPLAWEEYRSVEPTWHKKVRMQVYPLHKAKCKNRRGLKWIPDIRFNAGDRPLAKGWKAIWNMIPDMGPGVIMERPAVKKFIDSWYKGEVSWVKLGERWVGAMLLPGGVMWSPVSKKTQWWVGRDTTDTVKKQTPVSMVHGNYRAMFQKGPKKVRVTKYIWGVGQYDWEWMLKTVQFMDYDQAREYYHRLAEMGFQPIRL